MNRFPVQAPPTVSHSGPGVHGGLRLTMRGRLLAAILLSVITVLAFSAGRASAGDAAATGDRPAPYASVWVGPGDTVWKIASSVDPRRDPRDVIAEINRLNDLSGGGLQAGRRLLVPRGSSG